MTGEITFQVARPPYLVAVGGDGGRLIVYRSLVVDVESPGYAPVADYIRDHGLVLVSTQTGEFDGMAGLTEESHYATPATFTFNEVHLPYLIAQGGDLLLRVDRSLEMSATDDRYQPVLDYLIEHEMVLVDRTVGPKGTLRGDVEQSVYATRDARDYLLMNTEET